MISFSNKHDTLYVVLIACCVDFIVE